MTLDNCLTNTFFRDYTCPTRSLGVRDIQRLVSAMESQMVLVKRRCLRYSDDARMTVTGATQRHPFWDFQVTQRYPSCWCSRAFVDETDSQACWKLYLFVCFHHLSMLLLSGHCLAWFFLMFRCSSSILGADCPSHLSMLSMAWDLTALR